MTGTPARAGRMVALLFALSLLLTACDADDVMMFLRGPDPAAPPAPKATDADDRSSASEDAPADDGDGAPASDAPSGDSGGSAPQATAQDADTPAPRPKAQQKPEASGSGGGSTTGQSAIEREILDLLNAARASDGKAALTVSADVSRGARSWSCDMATSGNFRHADLRSAGVNGENIAWGQRSASEVHQGWMNSPGHRDNRMSDRWTEYGVGVCSDDSGRLYFTERFR